MKFKHLIFMSLLSFLFSSCEKPDFDKLVCETYNGSLPPEYQERYTVEVTANKITYTTLSANAENFELTEKLNEESKIDSTDFAQIKKQVYQLGVVKCKSSDDCDGGGTFTITGYKGKKTVFSNTYYGCNKDCTGFYDLLKFLNNYKETNK